MKNLLDLIIYIFQNYPNVNELSKPRLVKLIYLIDWKHAVDYGKPITPIKWYFNHYGPYVEDVISLIKEHNDIFRVTSKNNVYGGISDKIKLQKMESVEISKEIKDTTDFIIKNTAHMNWSNFISLVYSTYPIKSNSRYTYLDLEENAKEFNNTKTS